MSRWCWAISGGDSAVFICSLLCARHQARGLQYAIFTSHFYSLWSKLRLQVEMASSVWVLALLWIGAVGGAVGCVYHSLRGIAYGMGCSVGSFDEGAMVSVWLMEFGALSSLVIFWDAGPCEAVCLWWTLLPGNNDGEASSRSSLFITLHLLYFCLFKRASKQFEKPLSPGENCVSSHRGSFFSSKFRVRVRLCSRRLWRKAAKPLPAWSLRICLKDELQLRQNGTVSNVNSRAHTP